MHKKQNKNVLIILILVVIFFSVSLIKSFVFQADKTSNKVNISIYRIKDAIFKNIEDRQIVIEDNSIFVGYNKKEIENRYYDLKIILNDDKVSVHINKLWKVFNESLYEEEYVNSLVDSIFDAFEIKSGSKKQILADYITSNYLISKGINKEDGGNKKIGIDKINVKSEIVNNELILTIYKEVDSEG